MLFHVLGPIEVHTAGVHRTVAGKPATVLATLLLHRAWVSLDQLADVVWPDGGPPSAVANLRTYVWQVRRALPEPGRVERRGDAYRLLPAPDEVDADCAARAAVEAARAADPAWALARLDEALGWWRGRAYPGLAAAAAAADQLDELRLDLREMRAARLLDLGRGAEAVTELRQVTAAAPLREGAWAGLMRALAGTGRRTESLLAYRRASDLLTLELDVPPGPELRAARAAVLAPAT
ncbi:AfsR/SARP family transcriptional regulator [Paractinoplanes maris]|uniref:AfsR/SARP family transcriptional regulator n=1 Tax=Paractinoplanes maris TaxID=1734446 RepID=UPI002020BEEF|nr:BTAD domain-containing putative transcriptional regulator [Actinoplanes maris]